MRLDTGEKGLIIQLLVRKFLICIFMIFLLLLLNPFPVAFGQCNGIGFDTSAKSFQAKGPTAKKKKIQRTAKGTSCF